MTETTQPIGQPQAAALPTVAQRKAAAAAAKAAQPPQAAPPPRAAAAAAAAPANERTMPQAEPGGISEDDPRRPGFVRQPFGAVTLKLSAAKRPGYHRHWFNDVLDRIQQATAAGYTHVTENGKPKTRVVGANRAGGAIVGYLMEIPEEWFKQDMAAQQRVVDEIDVAIRGGTVRAKEGDGRYVPEGAIKIEE